MGSRGFVSRVPLCGWLVSAVVLPGMVMCHPAPRCADHPVPFQSPHAMLIPSCPAWADLPTLRCICGLEPQPWLSPSIQPVFWLQLSSIDSCSLVTDSASTSCLSLPSCGHRHHSSLLLPHPDVPVQTDSCQPSSHIPSCRLQEHRLQGPSSCSCLPLHVCVCSYRCASGAGVRFQQEQPEGCSNCAHRQESRSWTSSGSASVSC